MESEQKLELDRLRAELDEAGDAVGLVSADTPLDGEKDIGSLRRSGGAVDEEDVAHFSLLYEDGILYWDEGLSTTTAADIRRRGRRPAGHGGQVVAQRKCKKLGESEVGRFLHDFDARLNPKLGTLRRLREDLSLEEVEAPPTSGKILLFIHGTASSNDKIIGDIVAAARENHGRAFLHKALTHYDQVLAFDHATLSVSPMLNAQDLAYRFRLSSADVDVITHSRGGLVTRWWMEMFDRPERRRRAVLVACPLGGTSLAAPDRVRNGLNLMSNVGHFMASGMSLIPFMQLASGLLRVSGSIVGAAANSPLADAVIALIPGLNGQSRVENNWELQRLHQQSLNAPADYFIVQGSFTPKDVGLKFWQKFADWKLRAANVAADSLIFKDLDGRPVANDLVVDTVSMTELAVGQTVAPDRLLSFDEDPEVFHTNYFRQRKTLSFIRRQLEF